MNITSSKGRKQGMGERKETQGRIRVRRRMKREHEDGGWLSGSAFRSLGDRVF